MPIITAIKPQKNKKRVNIHLDGKFGFGLDLETFMKRNLKVEQELSEDQISTIVKEGEFQTTYDKILRFASLRPRSSKEFDMWLKKHKVHKSLHKELFERLKNLDLLDDSKFANWWISQRQEFRPKSKRVLLQELRQKGIEKEIIDKAIKEAKIDEYKMAQKVVDKKMRRWERLDGYERKKKIYGFLLQRGFPGDVIREVLQDIEGGLD